MTRFRIEWDLLGGGLLSLLLATTAALAMIYGSAQYLQDTRDNYKRQRAKLDGVTRLYQTARDDRSLYSQYVSRYEELEQIGVIGEEPRLTWVEALESANDELKLPVLKYEINPQRLVKYDAARYASNILQVYRSSMHLQASLLHEMDLLTLLENLRQQTSGRFEVKNCSLKMLRAGQQINTGSRSANLSADCLLNWYTVRVDSAATDGN